MKCSPRYFLWPAILSMLKDEQWITFVYLYLKWGIFQNGSMTPVFLLSKHGCNVLFSHHKPARNRSCRLGLQSSAPHCTSHSHEWIRGTAFPGVSLTTLTGHTVPTSNMCGNYNREQELTHFPPPLNLHGCILCPSPESSSLGCQLACSSLVWKLQLGVAQC